MSDKKNKFKLAALWKKTLPNGTEIMTGRLGGAVIEIWPNNYKKSDKHPDYNIIISEPYKKEENKVTDNGMSLGETTGFLSEEIPF